MSAHSWLHGGLKWGADKARDVTYRREGVHATLSVIPGKTLSENVDNQGLITLFVSRDYIIRKQEFEAAGLSWPPRRDDRIEDTDGTYQCMPIPGEGETRKRDTEEHSRRSHWKQIATP